MFPIRDTLPSRSTPIVTYLLIGLNAVVFWFQISLPERALEAVMFRYGLVPASFFHPYPGTSLAALLVPWITHMFLHGGWLHLIGNMWTLWIFGDNVEDRMGKLNFLIFYLLCGLAAATTQAFLHPAARVPMVGASGAISGVMGAYLILCRGSWIVLMIPIFFWPFFFAIPAALYLVYWFFLQWIAGTVSLAAGSAGGVAWWAHIGGFLFGVLFHPFFASGRRRGHYPRNYCWLCTKNT